MALYLIDIISQIRVKEIKLFSELYQKISNAFSYIHEPNNKKLATLLHYQGFKFEKFKPELKEEEILNLYPTDSPLYYIAWDKVDDFKSKFPNRYINWKSNDTTLLDFAIKYGSEFCFNYLKNLGSEYTDKSEEYAVQGGNKEIFMQMIEECKSFDNMINTALNHRNYEIADFLKSNFGQTFDSIAESMYFGNYDVASYLFSNGADINKIYINNNTTKQWSLRRTIDECPLSIAINADSIEIVQFLVEHGADVNMKLSRRRTIDECPLSIAINADSIEIVQFLVEHGADVNMKLSRRERDLWWSQLRRTIDECPLSIAINADSIEIVQFLVEHGADVNMKLSRTWEECPLSIANKMKSIEIVQFLVKHGATDV